MKLQRDSITKYLIFFSIFSLSTQKSTLGKLSLLAFSQGCFLSYLKQIFREAQRCFNVSVSHQGEISLKGFNFAPNKKGTFQYHKNLQKTKIIIPAIMKVLLMARRFLLLSNLAEKYTQSNAVRMGYDNSITSFS